MLFVPPSRKRKLCFEKHHKAHLNGNNLPSLIYGGATVCWMLGWMLGHKVPWHDLCPQGVQCIGGPRQSLILGLLCKLTGARLAYLTSVLGSCSRAYPLSGPHLVLSLQMPPLPWAHHTGYPGASETWLVVVISIPQQVLLVCTLSPSLPCATPGQLGSLWQK